MKKNELMRKIPKIDEVLQEQCLFEYLEELPKALVLEGVREGIENLREKIAKSEDDFKLDYPLLLKNIVDIIEKKKKNSIRRVINGTGTIIHTNLGRSNLSEKAAIAAYETASFYSNLEYDISEGKRGQRIDHIENLIKKITGAEAALAVNNNAAATMITLSALGKGKEMPVSRGELVEIGGSFRIPDIMEESGCRLREVGTTNKTKIKDYEEAINEETAALLKVHTSNYRIVGFTEEASLEELVALGEKTSLPVIYDMGSGLILDLSKYGIDEPNVKSSLDKGVDLILFSGDKLLGGPQCGLIIGKAKYIHKLKNHPLARILRLDKMTLAALEVTLKTYIDYDKALSEIPVLKMITSDLDSLKAKAEYLIDGINELSGYKANLSITEDQIGGGSAPTAILKGYGAEIEKDGLSAEKLERLIRKCDIPVICRIKNDTLVIVVRTVKDEELDIVLDNLRGI